MAKPTPPGVTLPVTEPLAIHPWLIVGLDDSGQLHSWASPEYAGIACALHRQNILAAAEEILRSLERPRG
jgi:hypothetical protein